MVDLLIAVDNPVVWHSCNLTINPSHYSFLRAGGPSIIAFYQDAAAHVYYNTDCAIGDRTIKYGVISTERLLEDLTQWTRLYAAGRLHKPVRVITPPPPGSPLHAAMRGNLQHALRVALLLSPHDVVTEAAVYALVTSVSYMGDVRWGVGGEDGGKVVNIVRGSWDGFRKLYGGMMDQVDGLEELGEVERGEVGEGEGEGKGEAGGASGRWQKVWRIRWDAGQRAQLATRLPSHVRQMMDDDEDEDYSTRSDRHTSPVQRVRLQRAVGSIVYQSSLLQGVKGVYTAGIRKSITYALRKLAKGWRF